MNKRWIKCGLPWTFYDWKDAPKPPNMNKEIKKKFGKTVAQAYKELAKLKKRKGFKAAQKEYEDFYQKVYEWIRTCSAWIEYQKLVNAYENGENQKSFCGKKLNQPGTLIEILDNKVLKQYLIGDINNLGGVCDDCMGFSRDAVIVRYKVLNGR